MTILEHGRQDAAGDTVRRISISGENEAAAGRTASHIESFVSKMTGSVISVPCTCFVGHDHTYRDWREAREDGRRASGE